ERPRPQVRQHRLPVVRLTITQAHRDPARGPLAESSAPVAPQSARRAPEESMKRLVEAPNASEAGGERHFAERHPRLVHELLREEHAPGLGDGDGRGAEVLLEQAPELPRADAEALRKALD